MTTNNPLLDAVPTSGSVSSSTVREKFAKGFALVVSDSTAIASEDFTDTPYEALIYNGSIFPYDSTDTTTAHDGLTCIVVSSRRYKLELDAAVTKAVIDKDLVAQPSSPTVGDAYLLTAAPTGTDWASKAKNWAMYTARGWVFVAPTAGMFFYVTDEAKYYHYSGSAWTEGLGDLAIANGSLKPVSLSNPFGMVVQQELNDPPVSPTEGDYYLVDTAPTGQWLTDSAAGKVATYLNSAWIYITGATGDSVYDVNAGVGKRLIGGTWSSDSVTPKLIENQVFQIPQTQSAGNNHFRDGGFNIFFNPTFQGQANDHIRIVGTIIVEVKLNSGSMGQDEPHQLRVIVDNDTASPIYLESNDVNVGETVWVSETMTLNHLYELGDSDSHELKFQSNLSGLGSGSNAYLIRVEVEDLQIIHYREPIKQSTALII